MAAAEVTPDTVEHHIRERLVSAVGGWRGSLEAALPTVGFVATWAWRHELELSLGVAIVIAVVTAGLRLASRQSLRYVLSGLFGIAIAAFVALRTGRAQDVFLPGILWSATVGVGSLLSIAVRWPVVGFLLGATALESSEDPFEWRRHHDIVRVCTRLTWVLVGLAAIRAVVMVPLYLAGDVTALGVAKLILGWPAYAGAVAVMGWLLVRGRTPYEPLTPPGPAGSAGRD